MSEKKETPILKAEHLTKMFPVKKRKLIEKQRYVHAAEDVSFEVYPGEVLGIVGESGSGKSTLARTILALTPSTSSAAAAAIMARTSSEMLMSPSSPGREMYSLPSAITPHAPFP